MKAIDDLPTLGCEVFSVIGGDPFLRDDLFEVLRHAKRKGMKIGLTTHAYNTGKFLPQIEKVGLDSIMVSIDGYRGRHDRIRDKPGAYEKCLHSIRFYYHIGIPVIGVSVIVMDETVHDIPKIIEDVYTCGGNRLRIQPLLAGNKKRNGPQTVENAFRLVFEARQKGFDIEISEGFGYLGQLESRVRSPGFFCGCGWDTFTIMPNGNIMGCPALNLHNYNEGNIKENNLRQIWFNRFEGARGDIVKDLPPDCKACRHVQICRGGCWLFRAYGQDPCFLPQAEEVAGQIID